MDEAFWAVCYNDSLNDGNRSQNEDDYDQQVKYQDWWGYTWNQAYNINKVAYTTGNMFSDGGWYASELTVQVRQHFNWVTVAGLHVTPTYPYSSSAGTNTTYTFTFDDTWGDGVRIIGAPGGTSYFTSISELAVYYAVHGNTQHMAGFSSFGSSLYQIHNDGSLWLYQGTPITGWQELDKWSGNIAFAVDNVGNLYVLHSDGSIWKYQGTPMSNWLEVDNNPAAVEIAADGNGNLYQLHNDGTIWQYLGPPITGWQQLDHNPAAIELPGAYSITQSHTSALSKF